MYRATILLSSIENVKKFVNIANQYDCPINLHSDKYIINGKSIMGIFSLDLAQPIDLEIEGNCPDALKKEMEPFVFNPKM